MNNPRLILPLAAAVLLGATVALHFLWPAPEVEPSNWELPPAPVAAPVAPVPARAEPVRPRPVQPRPVMPETHVAVEEPPREPLEPNMAWGDVREPEVAHQVPPEPEPVEPEARPKPAWRSGRSEVVAQ